MIYLAPSGINNPLSSLIKNAKTSVSGGISSSNKEKQTWSNADMKKYAAKLRKTRWTIYESMASKKMGVLKILAQYKKMVKKPHEVTIWKEKMVKTSEDVQMNLKSGKDITNVKNVERKSCAECNCTAMLSKYMERIDCALLQFSAMFHGVKGDQQSQTKTMKPEFEEKVGGDTIVTAACEDDIDAAHTEYSYENDDDCPVNTDAIIAEVNRVEEPDDDISKANSDTVSG